MSVGYNDYTRLSQDGGTQLYSASGSLTVGTILFQGYVGSWPYVNSFTSMNSSTDFAEEVFAWYPDSSFSTAVGFRIGIRTGASFASVQYANLGPWLRYFYNSKSGANMPFLLKGIYGATGPADQIALTSLDVPLFTFNQVVAAGGSFTQLIGHIQPGEASLQLYANGSAWDANMQYYDYGSSGYLQTFHADNRGNVMGGVFDLPMLDAPHKFTVNNTDTVSRQFVCSWMSK